MPDQGRILDAIGSPQDVHCLTLEELEILCAELRAEIVNTTAHTGGHLASSLGAVEIIVALHSLLNCPKDRIVFDVGHQAYAHKLLTGRLERFSTLRQIDGISGFPNPLESAYDAHASGHASDSLSVALGLAKARQLSGGCEKVVAVIGDAALGGGMAFEALNHIGQEQIPMVIVLNDNEMSISRPVGALVRHLGRMRATTAYRETRDQMQAMMEDKPFGQTMVDLGRKAKDSLKQFIIPHSMIFEQLGITCTTPINGHDLAELRDVFSRVLETNGPVLVHVVTKKGHGYDPAQNNPELFHGVGPFDIAHGTLIKKADANPTYTSVFGRALCDEAQRDERVVAITAAMLDGTGLAPFAKAYPERFFDTGITEEHAVGLASGLSLGGKKPVVAIYSTFLQRALDQIIIDNALIENHVVFAIDRAGVVGDDGPTHQGAFDIAYLRMIPNMRMLAPSNEAELVHALHTALALDGPVALRYPRGEGTGAPLPDEPELLEVGRGIERRAGSDVTVLAFGRLVNEAVLAADALAEEGVSVRVVDMRWVKPFDEGAVREAAQTKLVVTLEEGALSGGVGQGIVAYMAMQGLRTPALTLGLPDRFIEQGKVPQVFARLGLDAQGIASAIRSRLENEDGGES